MFVGTCDPAPLPYTLPDMAKEATGLMVALLIDKIHVAGASMGGVTAQLIAIHFPYKVLILNRLAASSGNPNRPVGKEEASLAMSSPPAATENADTLDDGPVMVYKVVGSVNDAEICIVEGVGTDISWRFGDQIAACIAANAERAIE